jgi:hypothetical protein
MTLRKGEDTHLKEEALDRTMWRARFGRGFGPVIRQTTKWMNTTSCPPVLEADIRCISSTILPHDPPPAVPPCLWTQIWVKNCTLCRTEILLTRNVRDVTMALREEKQSWIRDMLSPLSICRQSVGTHYVKMRALAVESCCPVACTWTWWLKNQKYRRTEAKIGGAKGMWLKCIEDCGNFKICQKGKPVARPLLRWLEGV